MVQKRLYATGGHKYGTRMLQAGEPLVVDGPRARLLTKMGWASESKPRRPRPQLDHDGDGKAGGSAKQTGDEVAALRKAYEDKFGRKPFNGWDAAKLREKLAGAAQGE
jgi:hypothetical protein